MSLSGWLDSRRPAPPPALRARIDSALGASLMSHEDERFDACLRAGAQLVESLLRNNATSRDSALDLLAADALVTYAFESACDRPGELGAHAREAMERIASLGEALHGDADVGAPAR